MENLNIDEIISQIKQKVKTSAGDSYYIPNIIEFCESKHYLNLSVKLYPMQRIILKCFYRGQPGNENLTLDKEEIELLQKNGLNGVLDKYHSNEMFRELVLVLGRRCIGERSLITDISGKTDSIGNIWDSGTRHIHVWGINEQSYDLVKNTNAEIIPNGIQPTYRITLSDGRKIEVTDNHPLLTVAGWKEIKNLRIKDRIAVAKRVPAFGSDMSLTVSDAKMLGYITGDGCCTTSNIFFTCSNEAIKNDVIKCLNDIDSSLTMKSDPWTTADSKRFAYKITKKSTNNKPNSLTELLRKCGLYGCNAHNKFIPDCILNSSQTTIAAYLNALFSCDGSIYMRYSKRDRANKPSISYTTVSERLARSVHHLLTRFGIFSILRYRKIKSNFKNSFAYEIDIHNPEDISIFLEMISFTGKEEKLKLIKEKYINKNSKNNFTYSMPKEIWELIDNENNNKYTDKELLGVESYSNNRCSRSCSPNRKKCLQIASVLNSNDIRKRCNDNILWLKIKSIEYIGNQRTFDISVPYDNQHNFIANDIIMHNSGKDFMVSLIALYEAMRLLDLPEGDPFKFYGIDPGNPIYILTVATAADQAKILFNEIKTKITASEYFRDKIGHMTSDTIWLKTEGDKVKQQKLIDAKLMQTAQKMETSIAIRAGHSNSDSLLGKRYYVLLFDEVASYKNTGGPMSGDRIYTALGPGTVDFKRKIGISDSGTPITVTDSKIISISSPKSEEGKLFQIYNETPTTSNRLGFKLPTWKVNLSLTEKSLREENQYMSPAEFAMEFGAEFSGTSGEKFIPDHYVDIAFEIGAQLGLNAQNVRGIPGVAYYAHLDPATSSHNYALVVLHIEDRTRLIHENEDSKIMKKERIKMFVVDHIKVWTPTLDKGIIVSEIDDYICNLAKLFRLVSVTYDTWESLASTQKLRSRGIPTRITPFRRQYKMHIYDNLEQLLMSKQLALPRKGNYVQLLEMELKCLKKAYRDGGYKIMPNSDGQVTTDDLADALAGACGAASVQEHSGYARSGTVYMPLNPSVGNHGQWNMGRGQYTDAQYKMLRNKLP